ncbi:hypothetical protein ACLI1A_00055 [Flavobacterium sp. RHBU_3]|uniref:hypothetical protein n=1 Tax=Flavobacterium sp. RHBU_3 TaxID=3391184 RepID=UPI0039854C92
MEKFIRFFSYLFYPMFIPSYATLFYFLLAGKYFSNNELYLIFIQVLILTVLLPVSIFYLLRSLGMVSTKMLSDKKERRLPLAINCMLLLMLAEYSLKEFHIKELYFFFIGLLISFIGALALVLRHVKASLHMMGIAAFTMFIISLSIYYHVRMIYVVAAMVICCGYVATSRLQEKAHTGTELIIGTLLGIVPQVGLWFLWLYS